MSAPASRSCCPSSGTWTDRRGVPLNDPAPAPLPVAVAQGSLVELAGRQARQLGLEVDRARAFVVRETLAAEGDQFGLRFRAGVAAGHELDHRLHLLRSEERRVGKE